jgi:seryl-tRNA synthetase
MLNLKYINENVNFVKECIEHKKCDVDIDNILSLDFDRKSLINKVEKLKADRNILNKEISKNRNDNSVDISLLINDMKEISIEIKNLDKSLISINDNLNKQLLYVPNIMHKTVPRGSVDDNVVIREWGEKPDFDFDIKDHKDLCELNSLVDFKRAINISGSGFPLYTGLGAKLERGLINFMLDVHSKNGYTELFPPFLVNANSPKTTGNIPKFSDDMYFVNNDNLYCIPTAEVPVTNIHLNESLNENELPKKYVAYSACFRREAGSYGKDTKGLLRLHQFNKVELVKFVKSEDSYDELELLLNDAETILQKLNLHYRVILLASGDLSFSAAKCYDIEVWSPYEKKYLEVSSCSNFESFQANRGNIKYRNKKTNKLELLHTLNGSGLATPRLMVALLETFQDSSGKIKIPSILNKYINYE